MATPAPAYQAAPTVQISAEAVQSLTDMGFPEPEARAALSAAMGNPDLAYEMLTGSIPMMPMHAASPPAAQAAPSTGAAVGIEVLRQHPQFNSLKQLIQQNPAALPQVLQLLGQQNPALLAAIQQNEAAFLTMMNEPITESAAPPAPAVPMGIPQGMPPGMPSPAQMMEIFQSLPPEQREQFARTLGLSGQELQQRMSLLASVPEDQLAGAFGGQGGGGYGGGPTTITLSHEEMAAVDRLCGLGFSRQAAAQAYLVCDKNEEAAANYLFDNGDEFGAGGDGFEHDEDMYN